MHLNLMGNIYLRGGAEMNCILNHCHGQIATDVAVITYYATLVATTILFALLSQSKTIQTAALIIAGAWLVSITYFLTIGEPSYFVLALLMSSGLGYQFWLMSHKEIFPAPLCVLAIFETLFLITALAGSLDAYWIIFGLNRIFEAMLAYIIGCSIYRMRKMKALSEEDRRPDIGLKFIAG